MVNILKSPAKLEERQREIQKTILKTKQAIRKEKFSAKKEKRPYETSRYEYNLGVYKQEKGKVGKEVKSILEKRKKLSKYITKKLEERFVSRPILKKSTMSYKMPDRPVSNIFHDENRFFKGAVKDGLL